MDGVEGCIVNLYEVIICIYDIVSNEVFIIMYEVEFIMLVFKVCFYVNSKVVEYLLLLFLRM